MLRQELLGKEKNPAAVTGDLFMNNGGQTKNLIVKEPTKNEQEKISSGLLISQKPKNHHATPPTHNFI